MSYWPFGANRPDPDRPSIFATDPAFGPVRKQKTGMPLSLSKPMPIKDIPKQPKEGSRVSLPGSLAPRRMG